LPPRIAQRLERCESRTEFNLIDLPRRAVIAARPMGPRARAKAGVGAAGGRRPGRPRGARSAGVETPGRSWFGSPAVMADRDRWRPKTGGFATPPFARV